MAERKYLGINVLVAAKNRLQKVFNEFTKVYLSFSGGKDSTVLLHLAVEVAQERGRKLGILFVDLEGQYKLTIDHIKKCLEDYGEVINQVHWVSLPISLRNAVSQFQPKWICWDKECQEDWIRQPEITSITNEVFFPFFRRGMEFEDFVKDYSIWLSGGELTACLVGIRTSESLNRWRTIASKEKGRYLGEKWTTKISDQVYNIYPIYDWNTEDIWVYHGKFPEKRYNPLYDRMHAAGLTIHQARICQPYGDDQRRGLWLYHVIEPETWGKIVARVNGANSGALYSKKTGNINGRGKVSLPPGHTWESFSRLLLSSMPDFLKEHYENKIATFLHWYRDKGYSKGIPDDGPAGSRNDPSWTRIAKALLRNDFWCKGLSFSQHKSGAYDRYKEIMKKRREKWGLSRI